MTARVIDYPTLAQAILDFSHRTDIANFQDYMIQFAELKIYRDIFSQNMGNGVQWMEAPFTATINATTGFVPVPSGYLAIKALQVSDGSGNLFDLLYSDPQWMYTNYPVRQAAGLPAYIARDGTNFVFGPFPDSAYAIQGTIYTQGTPLTAANPTTWMTTNCPDLLLAACMVEVQPFLRDGNAMQSWSAIYQAKLTGLLDLDKAERFAPGNLTIGVE
ncbi:MAG: hypothetical protein RB191_21740 [Terriglobia bacterium]|nr:hypothetical protein [Terriglobia bacterium]